MVPPTLNTFPILRFLWKFAHVFSTSFPWLLFIGFWIFKIFFEKLQFFCRSGLRKFFRHPNYMVLPTLNTFPKLRFLWNYAHVFSTSFPKFLFLGFWIFKIYFKDFGLFLFFSFSLFQYSKKEVISHIKKPSAWKKVAPHHSFVPQKRLDQK